ncbi:MAG: transketolase [Saprospiraceae bacterium]|nr:transketolase [Saprospiraceae bacterium]
MPKLLQTEYLEVIAQKVRHHIIDMSTNGGCFIGASLSCADIMVYLYCEFLNISKKTLDDDNRDFLLLSKGHDVPAMYATFAEMGWIEPSRLKNHLLTNDHIYWHPNRNIPGVEFHSGSLGHVPAVGLGVAMDCAIKGKSNKVIVITGDGELNEGSVWETLLVASAYKMNNFTLVVDRNAFQANMATEDLIPLEPLIDKFVAFGCAVRRIDGHDFSAMHETFNGLPFSEEKPNVIICDTIRGKGLPSIERRADRWFVNFNMNEIIGLHAELDGGNIATIDSEILTVR